MAKSPDLSEFYKLSKPRSKPCHLRLILDGKVSPKLSSDETEQLEAALEVDKGIITNPAIRDWLAGRDHVVTDAAVSVHRRKVCSCGRS